MKSLAAILLVLSACQSASAIYIRHDRSVNDYNSIGGRPSFASSGYLADSRDGFEFASGTLVSPTKVLTAAHVVDADADLRIDDLGMLQRLTFGTQRFVPRSMRANVKSVVVHPGYKGGVASHDLAVITLKQPIYGVKPGQLSGTNATGRRGAMVGYGYQGTGIGPELKNSFDKLGAFNEISILQNGIYKTDFDSPTETKSSFGSKRPLTYEGTTASGDSGSALWADVGPNKWQIVGVLNGGFNNRGPDSLYGDISVYASLLDSTNVTFLRNQGLTVLGGNGWRSNTGSGDGTGRSLLVGAVPEPTSIGLLSGLAAIALLGRRRRAA